MGVFLVATNKLGAYMNGRFCQERTLILVGSAICCIGVLFLFQFPGMEFNIPAALGLFFTSSILIAIGFGMSWPIVPALFSKLVGNHPSKVRPGSSVDG